MEQQILDIDESAVDIRSRLASKGTRFGNLLIDGILIGFPMSFISNSIVYGDMIVIKPYQLTFENQMAAFGINIVIYVIYYVIMEHSFGKTVGKMMTGTKVVNQQGEKPTLGQIIGRSFARNIPFEPFSFLGEEPVGWHDSLSKTYVINEK